MKLFHLCLMSTTLMLASCADDDSRSPTTQNSQPANENHNVAMHGGHGGDEAHSDIANAPHESPNKRHVALGDHRSHRDSVDGNGHRTAHHSHDEQHAQHADHSDHSRKSAHDHNSDQDQLHNAGHGKTHDSHVATHTQNADTDEAASDDAATIFARRILPILKADNSSSCTECHFAGVELRDFILDDQAKTFASLKATGMIDVTNPDESKILRFIGRKPDQPDPLVEKVRRQEFAAFRSWIRAAVSEPELLAATSDVEVGTSLPPEVIRHARKDRVLSSFIDNIWSEMGRCVNCHSPDRNRSKIGHNGLTKEDVDAISWIVPHDPAATLRKLVDSGNIDTDTPEDSQVLTKPAGIVEHGGGPKFHPGSTTYRNFARFLSDYAAVASGTYRLASDLPSASKEVSRLSEQQLRLTDIPSQFKELPMQVNLYRWNGETKAWSEDRWATGFSTVNAEELIWQNPILVTAPRDSERAPTLKKDALLPAGAYLIRIYADTEQKTRNDPLYVLGDDEFVGQVEITGEWKPGYQPPKIVKFPTKDSNHAFHRRRQNSHDHNQPHGDEKVSLAIGAKVPDFEVTLNGHRRKLSDLQKDRTLTADGTFVLTFWCSFCHSCRHVEKDLDELASEFKGTAGVIAMLYLCHSAGGAGRTVPARIPTGGR